MRTCCGVIQRSLNALLATPIRGHLSPGANQTHAKGTKEDQQAGDYAILPSEVTPALVAQKIFRKELDKGCKRKQTGRNGIHDSNEDETDFGIGAVEHMRSKANGLTDRCPIIC